MNESRIFAEGLLASRYSGRLQTGRLGFGTRDFSLLHDIQTGSGAQLAPYPMNTGGCFPVGKANLGVKLNTHLDIMPRSRMMALYHRFLYVFMAWCLISYA
jgi:hypothetical protein